MISSSQPRKCNRLPRFHQENIKLRSSNVTSDATNNDATHIERMGRLKIWENEKKFPRKSFEQKIVRASVHLGDALRGDIGA